MNVNPDQGINNQYPDLMVEEVQKPIIDDVIEEFDFDFVPDVDYNKRPLVSEIIGFVVDLSEELTSISSIQSIIRIFNNAMSLVQELPVHVLLDAHKRLELSNTTLSHAGEVLNIVRTNQNFRELTQVLFENPTIDKVLKLVCDLFSNIIGHVKTLSDTQILPAQIVNQALIKFNIEKNVLKIDLNGIQAGLNFGGSLLALTQNVQHIVDKNRVKLKNILKVSANMASIFSSVCRMLPGQLSKNIGTVMSLIDATLLLTDQIARGCKLGSMVVMKFEDRDDYL